MSLPTNTELAMMVEEVLKEHLCFGQLLLVLTIQNRALDEQDTFLFGAGSNANLVKALLGTAEGIQNVIDRDHTPPVGPQKIIPFVRKGKE